MKQLLTFFLLLSATSIWAQQVQFSKPQQFNANKDKVVIGGWVGQHLMVYYTNKNESLLDLYDAGMNRKAIVTLNFMPDNPTQVKLLPRKNEALMFYGAQLSSKELYYIARLNAEGKIIGRPKAIDTASQNFFGNTKLSYHLIHSGDHSKVAVFSYRIKDSKLEYGYSLANDSLEVLHSSNNSVPTKSFYEISQVILKDDGRLLVLLTDLATSKNNEVAEAMLYIIEPTDKRKAEVKAFTFDFGDAFTSNLILQEDIMNTDLIHFAGLSQNKPGYTNGVYAGTIDLKAANNSIIQGSNSLLPADMDLGPAAAQAQNRNYIIKDIAVKNDGGMIITAEAFTKIYTYVPAGGYGRYSMGYGGMHTQRSVEYYYGNILLLETDPNHQISSSYVIPKWQRSVDDAGLHSSFSMLNSGIALNFVFNENNGRAQRVVGATLPANGTLQTQTIATQTKAEGKWIPKMGKQVAATEMIIPLLSSNKLQLAKISF